MADSPITWSCLADFDNDGTPEYDLRPYIIGGTSGIRLSRGVDHLGNPRISQMTIVLDNSSGIFTPDYSGSALYGQVKPDVLVQVAATHLTIGYTRYTGYAASWKVTFGVAGRCTLTLVDLIGAYLAVSEPVYVTASTARDTDGGMVAIRDYVGLVAGDCSFDDGIQDMPLHFVNGQTAIEAMQDCSRSEMSGIPPWMTADGKVRFESRQSRLGVTVDDTWGDGTSVIPELVSYELDTTDLVDTVTVTPTIFTSGQADTEIFRLPWGAATGDSLFLAAGQRYEVVLGYGGPVTALTTPAEVTDYLANTAIGGTGTDRTSSLTVTATDLGASARLVLVAALDLYVTKMSLRGQMEPFAGQSPKYTAAKSNPFLKVSRGVELLAPYSGDSQAVRDYAVSVLRTYRYPYPRIKLSFAWTDDSIKAAMLAVELGDLIKFADMGSGVLTAWTTQVNDWWYVEAIDEVVVPATVGRSEITLVPSYLFRNLDRCVHDGFTRANATGDLGTSSSMDVWSADGNMDITSNKARANSDTLQMPLLDLGAGANDQVVEVDLAAIGAGDEVGIVLRATDADNQIRVYLDKGSNEVIAEKNVATVVTELSSPAFTVGTAHELRAMVQGTRLRVWVDFVLRIDVETGAGIATGTKCGLFARNANATTTFDDFAGEGL